MRYSPSALWILVRMVRAPVSRLEDASHTGTMLCVSTSWNGTDTLDATCHMRFIPQAPKLYCSIRYAYIHTSYARSNLTCYVQTGLIVAGRALQW